MTTPTSASDAAARSAATRKGIAWMVLTGVLFVAFTGIVRHLGSDMSPVQAAFIRYAMGLCILAPVFLRLRATGLFSKRIGLHAFRGTIHGVGVMLWFYAMARLPIAEVTALGFTVPIFVTIGAALFLGERLHARRIGAVLAGFAGAMLIVQPGFRAIEPGVLAQLVAAPMFAMSFVVTKKLTETDSNTAIVAYLAVFVTLVLALPAFAVWRTPAWEELAWLFLAACIATLGHLSLTQAFRLTELTVVQPVFFLQLVWATLIGFYIFGEAPDVWTWIGGGVVVASATYIAHREARIHRAPVARTGTSEPPATLP